MSIRIKSWHIFLYFTLIRAGFLIISGFDGCQLCPDCYWINNLSEGVIQGNFNFDIGRFIVSPFYQFFMAGHKILLGEYWKSGLVISQVILSALSGIYLFKLAEIIFSRQTAIISALIYGVFPLTLWWVGTFCTESVFQSFLIFSVYTLVKSAKEKSWLLVLVSASFFSLTFLTKSHILVFSPFIVIYFFLNISSFRKALIFSLVYGGICFIFTLPFGMYNLKKHNQYVISSNGAKFHFYTGNSNFGYKSIVEVPPKGTEAFSALKKMRIWYFNGTVHDSIMSLPHSVKQDLYLKESINWIKQNPMKFVELKLYNGLFFLFPGVSIRHYSFKEWLLSFVVSFPVYLLAYIGIILSIRNNFKIHFFVLGLFLTMLAFSVIWYTQNRFRTITLEPFYIIYASQVVFMVLKFIKKRWGIDIISIMR